MKTKIIAGVWIIFVLFGCASTGSTPEQPRYTKIPMTLEIVETVGGEEYIKEFQYYISSKVELSRVEREEHAGVDSGRASLSSRIMRNRININSETKGIVLGWTTNEGIIFETCFEQDDKQKLDFVLDETNENGYFYLPYAEEEVIQYGDEYYTITYPENDRPYLLIEIDQEINVGLNERTATGRSVGETKTETKTKTSEKKWWQFWK